MTSLTAKEVTTVKGVLAKFEMAVRDAMRNALAEARGDNADAAGAVHDLGEESVADELLALNSALAERHGHELVLVEQARQRIANGSIGVCADCEGAIGVARLVANPVAARCIGCEALHERTYAHGATPRL